MKAMAEKLRKWIKRQIGGYTREETAKKYPLPKAMRDVLSGKAPGACTSVEFLKVDFLTECTEQPEKEDAPTVDAVARCKDCIYEKDAKWNRNGFRICPATHMEIVDDDFCSYGERKEKNNDTD